MISVLGIIIYGVKLTTEIDSMGPFNLLSPPDSCY